MPIWHSDGCRKKEVNDYESMFFTDLPTTMTLVTSLVITVVCGMLSKKIHWIGNFTMAFALIISMCSSVLWVSVFK